MYNLSEQLLEQYGWETSEVKKGRGVYICVTEEGKRTIKPYEGSEARAEILDVFLQSAKSRRIPADVIVRTKNDTVLAQEIDGSIYYAREYIEGRECEAKSREDVLLTMKALGYFHHQMQDYEGEFPESMCVRKEALIEEYEKHTRELKKVRNYIRGKKRKNEFEVIFWQNYEVFLKKAEEVTEKLRHQMETLEEAERKQMEGICHGDFNQHNVLIAKNTVWLTNFENAACDVLVRDIAHFLRKIMEKHNWNIGLAADMLKEYEKERSLTKPEWEQLYIRLSYPEKFWKIANHYYNTNKAWVSGRSIEKLQKVIAQEEQRTQFLNLLNCFVK